MSAIALSGQQDGSHQMNGGIQDRGVTLSFLHPPARLELLLPPLTSIPSGCLAGLNHESTLDMMAQHRACEWHSSRLLSWWPRRVSNLSETRHDDVALHFLGGRTIYSPSPVRHGKEACKSSTAYSSALLLMHCHINSKHCKTGVKFLHFRTSASNEMHPESGAAWQ